MRTRQIVLQGTKIEELEQKEPIITTVPLCQHRGQPIATTDSGCASGRFIYQCNGLNKPCWDGCVTPWNQIKSTPEVNEPVNCNTCLYKLLKPISVLDVLPPISFPDERVVVDADTAVILVCPDYRTKLQLEITYDRIAKYANKIEAQLVVLEGNRYPEWPMANKWRINSVTKLFKRSLYLDCDIIINSNAPNIFEEVHAKNVGFYNEKPDINKEWYNEYMDWCETCCKGQELLTPTYIPNGGVLVIPQGSTAYQSPRNKWNPHWCIDQFLLGGNLMSSFQGYTFLSWKWNHGYIKKTWERDLHGAWFIHTNGCEPIETRLELLKRLDKEIP